jgi:hypothetical protein
VRLLAGEGSVLPHSSLGPAQKDSDAILVFLSGTEDTAGRNKSEDCKRCGREWSVA